MSGLHLCFFADDVVPLVSLNGDLQLSTERFLGECELVGMRISNSKYEIMSLSRRGCDALSQLGVTYGLKRRTLRISEGEMFLQWCGL